MLLNLRQFFSVLFFPISLFLASSYFIPEAKASCDYWTDEFGTSHEYCVTGNLLNTKEGLEMAREPKRFAIK